MLYVLFLEFFLTTQNSLELHYIPRLNHISSCNAVLPTGLNADKAMANLQKAKQAAKANAVEAAQGLAGAGAAAVGNIATTAWDATRGVAGAVGNVAGAIGNQVQDTVQGIQRTRDMVDDARQATRNYIGASIKNAPANLARGVQDTVQDVKGTFETASEVAGAVGEFAQAAVPLPPATQMLSPQAWKQSYTNYGPQIMNQYGALSDTLEAVAEGITAKYCSNPIFLPVLKEPASFVGPSFALTFSTGSCILGDEFDPENPKVKKYLDCTGPAIDYVKSPASFTSKYKTAPIFVSKECPIVKEYGEEIIKVLYVFDGTTYPNITKLTSEVTEQMRAIMGGLTAGPQAIAAQLQNFMSAVPTIPLPQLGGGGLPKMNFDLGNMMPQAQPMQPAQPAKQPMEAGNKYSEYGIDLSAIEALAQN